MISPSAVDIDREKGNFHFDSQYAFDAGVGLTEEVVRYISEVKSEDPWLLQFRLKALETFLKKTYAHPLGNQRFAQHRL